MNAHKRPQDQALFPIVQGTLYADLREQSAKELIQRDARGFAIGGLRYILKIRVILSVN